MRKIVAIMIALAVAAPAAAQQVVDRKFDRQPCTTFTGGVGGHTTSYGSCDPIIVKEVVTVEKEVVKEVLVPVPVPAPVQKKKPRE